MAEKLVVIPGHSIGSFCIGMNREEIWKNTKKPITSFFKTPFSRYRTDDISHLGIHVHYHGDTEICSEIEAWTKVDHNKIRIELDGFLINGKRMSQIRDWIRENEFEFESDHYRFSIPEAGIGFYCQNFESEDSTVDGIHLFKPIIEQAAGGDATR